MKVKFSAEFLLIAFIMKIAGEFVHEVIGHGLFVLLFGGRIIRVYLSILWPYELSYIRWSGNLENWQIIWIEGGGILTCTIVSVILQILLLLNVVKNWRMLTPIFWLAFWTFLNPAGYLILGGISLFGDIVALIARGALTRTSSIMIGLAIFLGSFISISIISKSLCNILWGFLIYFLTCFYVLSLVSVCGSLVV
ncbi:TPA: hypothetical protein EYP75_04300 [Candidatus Bathyarchaeota archaeon]|nr:hypothetical protein [Candidatus Bathyarchaeota archaeon]